MRNLLSITALCLILLPSVAFAQLFEPVEGLSGGTPAPAPASTVGEPPPGDPTYMPAGSMGPSGPNQMGTGLTRPNQSEFTALAGVPGITDLGKVTMSEFLNALYRMLIVIGALWAVLKITLAGLKYMGSDNFGNKAEAKEDIKSSLLGLLILLATALIITTVMGSVDLNAFRNTPIIPYNPQPPAPLTPVTPSGDNTIAIQKDRGCDQTVSGSCGTGNVAIFKGSGMGCAVGNSIPAVSGQSTFKYMSQAQCSQVSGFQANNGQGNLNKLIKDGKTIYGIHEVRSGQTQPTPSSLLDDCKATGGSQVVKTDSTYYYPFSIFAHYYGYICSN